MNKTVAGVRRAIAWIWLWFGFIAGRSFPLAHEAFSSAFFEGIQPCYVRNRHYVCEHEFQASCKPQSAYFHREQHVDRESCVVYGESRICGKDIAIVMVTSNATAARVHSSMITWIPAALRLNIAVIITAPSEEAVRLVLSESPDAPIYSLGLPEVNDNVSWARFGAALNMLRYQFPERSFYMKVDDDSFLFPGNLIDRLAYDDARGSELAIYGNTLSRDANFVSGGAGYIMTNASMQAFAAKESECVEEMGDFGTGEDVLVSACLEKLGARFVHVPGMQMSSPLSVSGPWKRHHWIGHMRYPVTFHWLTAQEKRCLMCTCIDERGLSKA